jgi:hypothetical protein
MLRNKIISHLIEEGFTYKTLSNFTDQQLNQLASRLINEQSAGTKQAEINADAAHQTYLEKQQEYLEKAQQDLETDLSEDNIEYDTDKMGNRDVEIDDKDLLVDDEELYEEAVSKAQKRFYCFVKACKESDNYSDCGKGTDIIDAAKSTSIEEINLYCKTDDSNLPEKVTETFESWVTQLVENDHTNTVVSKKSLMEMIKLQQKRTDLFDSMEQEEAFDMLNKLVLDKDGYELKVDELERGEDTEESVLLMFLESPTGHVWDIAIFTDGNIYMDNAPINDSQDFEEEIKEKETRQEGELAETVRDDEGEYIGAPRDSKYGQQTTTAPTPLKTPTIAPSKPGEKKRRGPFERPKTTPKPKARKSKTPDWFNFDEIKSDVEKKK